MDCVIWFCMITNSALCALTEGLYINRVFVFDFVLNRGCSI